MTSRPLRIAFLTPQFVTERSDRGGLASYVSRIAVALADLGHQPEVFTVAAEAGVCSYRGMRVEHVAPAEGPCARLLRKAAYRVLRWNLSPAFAHLRGSAALNQALERRHRTAPFDLVQSSNYGLTGFFVRRRPRRVHVMRCAWSANLWRLADGANSDNSLRLLDWLEGRSMRKADMVYSPSCFLADYLRLRHGVHVQVVRPPLALEVPPAADVPANLPSRYLVHFGFLGPRKGTDVLAEALPLAWRKVPDLCMVWAGQELRPGEVERYRGLWGVRASQVFWVGQVPKPELYALVRHAEATVIPSRVDNLPNTAIESLALSVPVIGSQGASIDELVEPGINGELVPIGQPEPLADAMVRVWRREFPWVSCGIRLPKIFEAMEPRNAAMNLLLAAGFEVDGKKETVPIASMS